VNTMAEQMTTEQRRALEDKAIESTHAAHDSALKLVSELEKARGEIAALEMENADLRAAFGGAASKYLQYGELRVLACLCERGLWAAGIAELSRLLDMPESTVSGHLAKLVEAGFAFHGRGQYAAGEIIGKAGVRLLGQKVQATRYFNPDGWLKVAEHWDELAKALGFPAEQ